MSAPAWLTKYPVAHRGFHDAAAGRIENTITAIRLAADRGFAIEIDVHLSADGQVFVFHDETLDRLTIGQGQTSGLSLADLQSIPFKDTTDRIPSLKQVLDAIGGRTPLFVEVKSHFAVERQTGLVLAVAAMLAGYNGPVAVMSFDPRMLEDFALYAPHLTRGIIADDAAEPEHYGVFTEDQRIDLARLAHIGSSQPHFLAYWVKLLPNGVSERVHAMGLPILTWTVRTDKDRATAREFANQMIFEGFDPEA